MVPLAELDTETVPLRRAQTPINPSQPESTLFDPLKDVVPEEPRPNVAKGTSRTPKFKFPALLGSNDRPVLLSLSLKVSVMKIPNLIDPEPERE